MHFANSPIASWSRGISGPRAATQESNLKSELVADHVPFRNTTGHIAVSVGTESFSVKWPFVACDKLARR